MEQENTNAKMFSSQFPWEKKVIIQSRRDTDETGQIDRIALISCFGAVSCDEALVNSFTFPSLVSLVCVRARIMEQKRIR